MTDLLHDRVVAALGDLYDIEDELGRGGMSVVYLARDVRLRRRVAIKILPPDLAYRADVRTRFLREAETAARLNHPNIVPIYAVDERGGLVYIVMAYISGGSLAARLAREPRPPVPFVRRVLREVADALAYAHAHGVVHRDIKPDNILLDAESGRALVTDFGIARAAEADSRLTMTGVAVGTPAYMSPEQAVGEREVDGRSDMYSLGVVGYQMLAGEPPFRAASNAAMLLKHIGEPPTSLAARRPDVGAELTTPLMRALGKTPDERDSAAQFCEALDAPGGPRTAANAPPGVPAAPRLVAGGDAGTRPDDKDTPSKERWRAARRAWRAQANATPGVPDARPAEREPDERPPLFLPSALPLRHELVAPAARPPDPEIGDFASRPLAVRIATFRRRLLGWAGATWVLAAVNMWTTPFLPWFLYPAWRLGRKSLMRWRTLEAEGLQFSDVLWNRVPAAQLEPDARRMPPAPVATAHAAPHASASSSPRASAHAPAPPSAHPMPAPAVQDPSASPHVRIPKLVKSLRRVLGFGVAGFGVMVVAAAGGVPELAALAFGPTLLASILSVVRGVQLRRLADIGLWEALGQSWRRKVPPPPPRTALARRIEVGAEVARLASHDVVVGAQGALLQRAVQDRETIRDVLAALSPDDLALVPDVLPTVNALVERIAALATSVHRLDADAPPDALTSLDARIEATERSPASAPDRGRRLALLTRQRSTVAELAERRATLHAQLESACLVLQNLRLDLLRLRSAGGVAALDGVTSATQEARALSRDIGHAADAVREVGRG